MTALRPERESAPYGGEAAYGGAESFEAEAFQPGAPFTDAVEPRQQWAAQQAPQYGQGDWYGQQQPYAEPSFEPYEGYEARPQAPYDSPFEAYEAATVHEHPSTGTAQEHPPIDEETVALRVEEARRIAAAAEPIPAPPLPVAVRPAVRPRDGMGDTGGPRAPTRAPEPLRSPRKP